MATTMSEWISVEDRLPEVGSYVLIHGGLGYFIDGLWYSATGHDTGRAIEWKVTHWMPLPEPPK